MKHECRQDGKEEWKVAGSRTGMVCRLQAYPEEGADVLLGNGWVQAPQLHPPILYRHGSLIDAAVHQACQGWVGLHLPCHGRIQGCYP